VNIHVAKITLCPVLPKAGCEGGAERPMVSPNDMAAKMFQKALASTESDWFIQETVG